MTDFRQPWRRVEIGGRRCQLQIVDPGTAFDLEPELVAVLGDTLALFLAAPDAVIGAALKGGEKDPALVGLYDDDPADSTPTTRAIKSLGRIVAQSIIDAKVDAKWVQRVFGRLILGRLKVGDNYIDSTRDWSGLGFHPVVKWQAFGVQIRQSFGPLWTRSPYRLRVPTKDYGVPEPTGVPVATRYASELASAGKGSVSEILDTWTPVRMIEIVEAQTYAAENERRAHEVARSGGKG